MTSRDSVEENLQYMKDPHRRFYTLADADALNNWDRALYKACADGDLTRVQSAIQLGATDLQGGCSGASRAGHLHIVQYLIPLITDTDLLFLLRETKYIPYTPASIEILTAEVSRRSLN